MSEVKNLLPQSLLRAFGPDLQEAFLNEYLAALSSAQSIVAGREHGRNSVFSIPEMFPYGLEGVLSLCAIKVNRAIGDLKVGQTSHAKSEMEDLVNYSAFFLAYYALIERILNVSNTNPTNTGVAKVQQEQAFPLAPESSPRRP